MFARLIYQAWTRTTIRWKPTTTIPSFLQLPAIQAWQVRQARQGKRRPAPSASSSCRGTRCPVTSATCTELKPATWLASFAARCFGTRTRSDVTCGGFTRMPKTNREVKLRLIEAKKSRCKISQKNERKYADSSHVMPPIDRCEIRWWHHRASFRSFKLSFGHFHYWVARTSLSHMKFLTNNLLHFFYLIYLF